MPALETPTRPTTTTENTADKDDLAHLFCGRCWRKARAHAQPRKSFCGIEKYVWTPSPHGDKSLCAVCVDLTKNRTPCTRCGLEPKPL